MLDGRGARHSTTCFWWRHGRSRPCKPDRISRQESRVRFFSRFVILSAAKNLLSVATPSRRLWYWAGEDAHLRLIPRHRVPCFIRVRNELLVRGARDVCGPVACRFRKPYDSEKQNGDSRCHGPGWHHSSRTRLRSRVQNWQRHLQCPFRRADRYALQAPRAFGGLDRDQLVDRQCRGTSLRALRAINAGLFVTADTQGTEYRCDAQQRPVRAEVAAPEVLHQHRTHHQHTQDDRARFPQ